MVLERDVQQSHLVVMDNSDYHCEFLLKECQDYSESFQSLKLEMYLKLKIRWFRFQA